MLEALLTVLAILIVFAVMLVILALILLSPRHAEEGEEKTKSFGVVLIGPIPIILGGAGAKALIFIVILFIAFLLLFLASWGVL